MGSKKKSIMKTITWRVISILKHVIIAFFFIGSVTDVLSLVAIANVVAMVMYYIHERRWANYKDKNGGEETKKISKMKAISWTLITAVIGLMTAYYYTKSVEDSVLLVTTNKLVSTVLYYYHERAWVRYKKQKGKKAEEKKFIEMKREIKTIE